MEVRRSRTCEKCKTSVPVSEVRLYPRDRERNWVLCAACCDYLKNRSLADPHRPITNQPKPVQTPQQNSVKPTMYAGHTSTLSKVKPALSGSSQTIPKQQTFPASPPMKSAVRNSIKTTPEKSVVGQSPASRKPVINVVGEKRTSKSAATSKNSRQDMFCGRCKYSFAIDPSRVGVYSKLTCPYCGKIDQIYDRKSGAQIKEDEPTVMKSLLYKKPGS